MLKRCANPTPLHNKTFNKCLMLMLIAPLDVVALPFARLDRSLAPEGNRRNWSNDQSWSGGFRLGIVSLDSRQYYEPFSVLTICPSLRKR